MKSSIFVLVGFSIALPARTAPIPVELAGRGEEISLYIRTNHYQYSTQGHDTNQHQHPPQPQPHFVNSVHVQPISHDYHPEHPPHPSQSDQPENIKHGAPTHLISKYSSLDDALGKGWMEQHHKASRNNTTAPGAQSHQPPHFSQGSSGSSLTMVHHGSGFDKDTAPDFGPGHQKHLSIGQLDTLEKLNKAMTEFSADVQGKRLSKNLRARVNLWEARLKKHRNVLDDPQNWPDKHPPSIFFRVNPRLKGGTAKGWRSLNSLTEETDFRTEISATHTFRNSVSGYAGDPEVLRWIADLKERNAMLAERKKADNKYDKLLAEYLAHSTQ